MFEKEFLNLDKDLNLILDTFAELVGTPQFQDYIDQIKNYPIEEKVCLANSIRNELNDSHVPMYSENSDAIIDIENMLKWYFESIINKSYHPTYKHWIGVERMTGIKCLYIEAKYWYDDFIKHTGCIEPMQKINRILKPILVRRTKQSCRHSSMGNLRTLPKGDDRVYVLCIRMDQIKCLGEMSTTLIH